MFETAARIKPLLVALDDEVPLTEPVTIDKLIELTKRFTSFSDIRLVPMGKSRSIAGSHVAFPEANMVVIFFRACLGHPIGEPNRECPTCRDARFFIAKELSHAFDGDDERTPPGDAEEMLLKETLAGSYSGKQAQADLLGSMWAVEMLFRYHNRVSITGDGTFPAQAQLTASRTSGDYSYFAKQFCVPVVVAELGLRDNVLASMKALRKYVGLPLFHYQPGN